MTLRPLAFALLLLAAPALCADDAPTPPAPGAPAAKKVENPAYTAWAVFKAGSWSRYENEAGAPGQKMTMTYKLIEVTAEKVVVEMVMTVQAGEQPMEMPAQRSDIPKMIEVAAPVPGVEPPKTTTKSGTANVTTPAGTFACNTMESTTEMPGMKSWSKFATSADVPNGLVKMESKTEMGETTVTSTITLVALSKA